MITAHESLGISNFPKASQAKPCHCHTVLIVEDHEDTRLILARTLRRRGFNVMTAKCVAEAIEILSHLQTDLLLCDIGLPDGTGWDVIKKVRETNALKAIAVSGYGTDSDLARSKAAGFNGHIVKPIDFPSLERMIASLFEEN